MKLSNQSKNIISIISLSLSVRLFTWALLLWIPSSGLVPAFDDSARSMGLIEGLTRWDVLHFLSIHRHGGRSVEQEWAFGQGIGWVLWVGQVLIPDGLVTNEQAAVLGASLLAITASVGSTIFLFLLTIKLTGSKQFAMLTSLLHIFSPSPSTQVVPYTEPFFAFFSFAGALGFEQLYHLRHRWNAFAIWGLKLTIAGAWAIATGFRPLGILMAAFWVLDWVQHSFKQITKLSIKPLSTIISIGAGAIETAALVCVTCSPFLLDQYNAYQEFCTNKPELQPPRPWCSHHIPAIYPFVQSYYWDVGFLRYWTPAQLPNFLISSPLYFVSYTGIAAYYRTYLSPKTGGKPTPKPFLSPRIAPYVHLHVALALLLFTNSHAQIILRQAASMPVVWWTLADRVGASWALWPEQKASSGWRWWWVWCGLWAPISILLWAGFYPPA